MHRIDISYANRIRFLHEIFCQDPDQAHGPHNVRQIILETREHLCLTVFISDIAQFIIILFPSSSQEMEIWAISKMDRTEANIIKRNFMDGWNV